MRFRIIRIRMGCRLLLAAALAPLAGCGSFYVDGATQEIAASQFHKTEPAHPVQLLVEFQTRGVADAGATAAVKARILAQVRESGIFSAVSEAPVAGGALLSITIDNVPTDDKAFSRGFAAEMTFGQAGTVVSDGYVCTARYGGPGAAPVITERARHAIHTRLGAAGPPPNSVEASSLQEAVTIMLRQVISYVLFELSIDPAFT